MRKNYKMKSAFLIYFIILKLQIIFSYGKYINTDLRILNIEIA